MFRNTLRCLFFPFPQKTADFGPVQVVISPIEAPLLCISHTGVRSGLRAIVHIVRPKICQCKKQERQLICLILADVYFVAARNLVCSKQRSTESTKKIPERSTALISDGGGWMSQYSCHFPFLPVIFVGTPVVLDSRISSTGEGHFLVIFSSDS